MIRSQLVGHYTQIQVSHSNRRNWHILAAFVFVTSMFHRLDVDAIAK